MNDNELEMKLRGETKVLKEIVTKSGNSKNVSSTQIGQQILLDEALRILPEVMDWINNGSAKVYRGKLKTYFVDEQFVLDKITQTLLFLSGSIYYGDAANNGKSAKTRHKNVTGLQNKIMQELPFNEVWRFLEVVVSLSQYFDTVKVNDIGNNSFNIKLFYTCNLSEVIVEKLARKASAAFYPMPMTTPPIPWTLDEEGQAVGGYEDYQYRLVRADKRYVNYNNFSEKIFNSINYIQSTPWKVNIPLLHTVKSDQVIPKREDYVKIEYPDNHECKWDIDLKVENVDLDPKEVEELIIIRKQFQDQVNLYKAEASDYESALGKYRAVKLAVSICERYQNEEAIYFPHSYDFRGRVYPLPIGLSPQGSDAVKSLLLYKNTKELSQEGIAWNWAYLASLYGDDKLDFLERVERGKELLEGDYREADEPYQFLSHQLELQKYVISPDYIPNTRVHLDACNSGSQFTSAITGDLEGCLATNVIPTFDEDGGQVRKDAYLLVATRALELTKEMISEAKDAQSKLMFEFFYELLKDQGRKICKVPVMVSNYGGTTGGRTTILWNLLRELKVDRKWINKRVAAAFSDIIGRSIEGTLKGGKAFEGYIHKMNGIIAKNNKPVEWKTSDGFHVVHIKNKELSTKQVTVLLPGARKSTVITKRAYSDDVAVSKMRSAISPNYIHSLDAELLRRVALKMKTAGIEDSDWIHDSFGCHPNDVELMLDITKREFAKLVRRAPLRVLDEQLRSQTDDSAKTIKDLANTKLPLLRGFNTSSGDLDIVLESNWFFS